MNSKSVWKKKQWRMNTPWLKSMIIIMTRIPYVFLYWFMGRRIERFALRLSLPRISVHTKSVVWIRCLAIIELARVSLSFPAVLYVDCLLILWLIDWLIDSSFLLWTIDYNACRVRHWSELPLQQQSKEAVWWCVTQKSRQCNGEIPFWPSAKSMKVKSSCWWKARIT